MNTISAFQYSPLNTVAIPQHSSAGSATSTVAVSATSVEDIISDLKSIGVTVTVRSVPNNPDAIGRNARSVGSFGSVTIAPNILEDMANDAAVRQKYFNKINQWMNFKSDESNWTTADGRRVTSMSMVIHECGTTHFVMMGEGCPPSERERSVEVMRYTTFGVTTIVFSCGKIRTEIVKKDYPKLSGGYNMPLDSHDTEVLARTEQPYAQQVAGRYEQMLSEQ